VPQYLKTHEHKLRVASLACLCDCPCSLSPVQLSIHSCMLQVVLALPCPLQLPCTNTPLSFQHGVQHCGSIERTHAQQSAWLSCYIVSRQLLQSGCTLLTLTSCHELQHKSQAPPDSLQDCRLVCVTLQHLKECQQHHTASRHPRLLRVPAKQQAHL
jgi:hypothetical protein